MKQFVAAVALVVGLGVAAPAALADGLTCEVVEIHASTTDNPSIDPELKDLKKKLKGPFASFNTFKKLARISKKLQEKKPQIYDTPKGQSTVLLERVDRPAKKRVRVSLDLDIEDDSGTRYVGGKFGVDAGDFLLFGKSISDSESIVTAVGCRDKR
jgi:hypothetical protein